MPWTIWRYSLFELIRLVLLSGAVLVSVISFAAAVKPLADGKLAASGAIAYMLLAAVPMLAYALPFASGFGATLAYHRMTQDNEVVAARAGGLGYLRLLAPAAAAGLAFCVTLAALNEQVIPRFLRAMEQMITLDLADQLVGRLERGESAEFGSFMVYADGVTDATRGGGYPTYMLTGVVAVDLDDDRTVGLDVSAGRAWLFLLPATEVGLDDPDATAAVLQLENALAVVDGRKRQEVVNVPPIVIPRAFRDDPKFLTAGELTALSAAPEQMSFVMSRKRSLAQALAGEAAMERLSRAVRTGEGFALIDASGREVRVRPEAMRAAPGGWELTGDEGVRVSVSSLAGGPGELAVADSALLWVEGGAAGAQPRMFSAGEAADTSVRFTLDLTGVRVLGADGALQTELAARELTGLRLPDDPMGVIVSQPADQLLEAAAAGGYPPNHPVGAAAVSLRDRIAELWDEVLSKRHERLAMAASCFVMVLTGAVTALRLRDRQPLIVYLWSFFPAVLTVVMISSGQQVIAKGGIAAGLLVLWSGVGLLIVYTLAAYWRLSRR